MVEDDRIYSFATQETINGIKYYDVHWYTRYIGEETELYTFGDGLGDQCAMMQIGDCFLNLIDQGKDPKLGRIILSCGNGLNAYKNFRGDYNVKWVYGQSVQGLEEHLRRHYVKTQLILNPHQPLLDEAERLGYETMYWHSGVNPRMFMPLGLERKGIGYRGVPKSKEQQDIMLEPAEAYDFERIHFKPSEDLLTIPEYNKWLNTKQIVLGMVEESRHNIRYIPTRFFEALASGTPLLTYKLHGIEESVSYGTHYPYQSTSAEETKYWIEYIFDQWKSVYRDIQRWSDFIREKHSYEKKLLDLFKRLEEL